MTLSYVGADFCGWQRQKGSAASGKPSIQGLVEDALSKITSQKVNVVASGRTDAGVHATGQVAHFELGLKFWDASTLCKGVNSYLPYTLRVLSVETTHLGFHAQRGAQQKQYSYYFQQGPWPLAHLIPYTWWVPRTLDLEGMQSAARDFIGTHDFKPFQAAGAKVGTTIRTVFEAEVKTEKIMFPGLPFECGGNEAQSYFLVRFRVVGSGFLKQMVRGMAGTLRQIGEGKFGPGRVQEILKSGDRASVGPTAPARALWLERVWYAD